MERFDQLQTKRPNHSSEIFYGQEAPNSVVLAMTLTGGTLLVFLVFSICAVCIRSSNLNFGLKSFNVVKKISQKKFAVVFQSAFYPFHCD